MEGDARNGFSNKVSTHGSAAAGCCSLATKHPPQHELMGFCKVRPSLLFRAELKGEITEWFSGNTQQDKIGVSHFASQFLDNNMYKRIFETGWESNKYSAGETN